MVVTKDDALDLPETQDIDVHVTLNAKEAKAYREMAEDLAAELDSGEFVEAVNVLAKLMKLRQIAAGFVKDTATDQVHVVGDSLRKAMLEVTTVTLAGEQRVVVSGYFRSECALIADALRKAEPNTCVEVITGATKAKDRLDIRQRFGDVSGNPGRMILVAQARTMSLSVNELVTASHMVNGSPSERRDDWVQLRGRLHRQGQEKPVTYWNCFTPGLIGNIMLDKHKDRGNLEKALLDHVRSYVRKV
jgi:SNF2 family DNA or RNA helicase